MTTVTGIVSILAIALASFQDAQDTTRVRNLDQRDLQIAMSRLATEHQNLVTVIPVGESRKGRRIEALRVAAGELAPGRPAILVVANVDGPLVWTSSLALDHVRELTRRYGSDARVKSLLDSTTLYVIPRVDVDAAEARFAVPLFEETASGPGVDDDRDGRMGEDPPADVDGDGVVAWMRVPDPTKSRPRIRNSMPCSTAISRRAGSNTGSRRGAFRPTSPVRAPCASSSSCTATSRWC
jgi:hypothetical protein